jgi:hypothetical protein
VCGTSLDNVTNPIAFSLGVTGAVEFVVSPLNSGLRVVVSHGTAGPVTRFYRVMMVSTSYPLDLDGDGIDDLWELQNRPPGALNGQDAQQEPQRQRPLSFWITRTHNLRSQIFCNRKCQSLPGTSRVGHPSRLSKSYQGNVSVLLGGSALPNLDYTIAGLVRSNLTAQTNVNGTSRSFRVVLIDPRRSVTTGTVALFTGPSTNAPASARYRVSPIIRGRCNSNHRSGSGHFTPAR